MSDYYDSKGIRHTSQTDAEMANERYLREERSARDKATDFQQKQAELQAEQLRVAERQQMEQMMHNARVEAQMEQKAREEAIHRQFTRDIQWLERSDPKGRFEFLTAKVQGEFVDTLADQVFQAFAGFDSVKGNEKAILDSAFRELVAVNAKWEKADSALKALERELDTANKLVKNSNPGCAAFGCLPVAIIVAIGMVGTGLEKEGTTGGVIAGIICGIVVLGVIGAVFMQVAERKKGKTQKAEVEPKLPQARKEAEAAKGLRQKALLDTKSPFSAWIEASDRTIDELVHRFYEGGEARTALLEQVEAAQTQYPPLCRVDVTAIGSADVDKAIAPFQQAVTDKALALQIDRSSVLARLGASATQEKLLAELSELSGSTLLGEPIRPDFDTLILTLCPPDKKIAIIKIVRELKSGLGLAEAKYLVENLPATVLDNSTSSEIEKAKQQLESEGAGVEVR
jgi:ribosomal protein L7/L12